jgi:hypothetical protein
MIEAYYGPRLKAYERRRQREMDRLKREAVEYDAKARFIQAVLKGTVELRSATDEQIVAAMVKHSLPPLSKPESADSVDAYEYLLKMRMDRVKSSAVEDARKHVEAAQSALDLLKATTAENLWLRDLDMFEKSWAALQVTLEASKSDSPMKKEVKKILKLKART